MNDVTNNIWQRPEQAVTESFVPLGYPLGAWPAGGHGNLTCALYDVDTAAATAVVSSTILRLSDFAADTDAKLEFERPVGTSKHCPPRHPTPAPSAEGTCN